MDNTVWPVYAVITILGLGVGFGVVYGMTSGQVDTGAGARSTKATSEAPATKASIDQRPLTPEARQEACDNERDALEKKLASLQATLTNKSVTIEGLEKRVEAIDPMAEPLEWYGDVTADTNRAKIERDVTALERECPGVIMEVKITECEEFPCTMVATTRKGQEGVTSMVKACPMLKRGAGAMDFYDLDATGEPPAYFVYQPNPEPGSKEVFDHLGENYDRRTKRLDQRTKALIGSLRGDEAMKSCDAGVTDACRRAGDHYFRAGQEDKGMSLLERACDADLASSCVSLVKKRCLKEKPCSEADLERAKQATTLAPDDGPGALDVYARVLCHRRALSDANAAFERSCEVGFKRNCGRLCE